MLSVLDGLILTVFYGLSLVGVFALVLGGLWALVTLSLEASDALLVLFMLYGAAYFAGMARKLF